VPPVPRVEAEPDPEPPADDPPVPTEELDIPPPADVPPVPMVELDWAKPIATLPARKVAARAAVRSCLIDMTPPVMFTEQRAPPRNVRVRTLRNLRKGARITRRMLPLDSAES
jgi:hypothetical protein